ncbi:hypothetical protein F5X96DRAFT_653581 [Biscogniauxia mediterranea]|nr:hypothetical protein F5X96DRAFT_653581 [Biscogniauxia mediterranea]
MRVLGFVVLFRPLLLYRVSSFVRIGKIGRRRDGYLGAPVHNIRRQIGGSSAKCKRHLYMVTYSVIIHRLVRPLWHHRK